MLRSLPAHPFCDLTPEIHVTRPLSDGQSHPGADADAGEQLLVTAALMAHAELQIVQELRKPCGPRGASAMLNTLAVLGTNE